jgi:hypothetical protein
MSSGISSRLKNGSVKKYGHGECGLVRRYALVVYVMSHEDHRRIPEPFDEVDNNGYI